MHSIICLRGLLILSMIITKGNAGGQQHDQTDRISRMQSVFDQAESDEPGMSFEEQVIYIETHIGSRVCGDEFPSTYARPKGNWMKNINPCYCDEVCTVLHNCCPDILMHNITSHDGGQGSQCVEAVPTGVDVNSIKPGDLMTMVTTCQDSTHLSEMNTELEAISPDVISKCENYDPSDPMQTLPVSSKSTKITYRNIFCAQCNDINITDTGNIYKWKASVKCRNGIEKLLSGNPDTAEIYRRLNSKDEVMRTGCQLKYVAEKLSGYDKKCKLNQTPSIDRCNQTGQWVFYDEKIDRACNMYTSIVFNEYKNMFCWLCNIEAQYDLSDMWGRLSEGLRGGYHPAGVSFEALMDFSDAYYTEREDTATALCEEHRVYDNITCQCQDLMCSEGKELSPIEDFTCASIINSNYLGYSVCLQIDFVFNHSSLDSRNIMNELSRGFRNSGIQTFLLKLTVKSWCPGCMRMSVYAEFLDYYQDGTTTMGDYDIRASRMIQKIKNSTDWLPKDLTSRVVSVKSSCPDDYGLRIPPVNDITTRGPHGDSMDDIEWMVYFLPFKMTNLCPHVELPANDFELVNDTLYHIATRFEVESHQVDVVDNMTLRLCRDAFLGILSSVDTSKCINQSSHSAEEDFDTWTIQGLVSIICTSLSLVCLFLTFLTYIIFPKLRDASGKNIMTLTLFLFLAQAFYEFAIEQFENETACKCFGILIHYFWLAAVFSMNACTVERFYKLCFPLRSRAFFYSRKPFIVASVYSLVSPLIIVGINILVNYEVTGHIGYGNSQICYIRELNSRIFGFAVPLAILLLANLILFVITIHTIRREADRANKSSSTRIGIKACVQLSFVTGLTWLLAFLYDSISISELGYVFTALIGLQGVMFFYSIVWNKRILALYRCRLGLKSQGSSWNRTFYGTSRSTDRGTHGRYTTMSQRQASKTSFTNKKTHHDVAQTSSVDSGVSV